MLHLLERLEDTGFAIWIRESPSLFAYTGVLSLHAIGLAIVVGFNTVIALRLLGMAPGLPLAPLVRLFPVMYVGFWVNALSGLLLLAAAATSLVTNVMFLIKLGFIALAVLNLGFIRHRVFADPAALALDEAPAEARKFAVASLVCWGFAIVAGRLTAYPYFVSSFLGIG